MKTTLKTLACFMLFCSSVFAQVNQPVDIPFSAFPILGMPFGGWGDNSLINNWKPLGINGFYEPVNAGFANAAPYMTLGMYAYISVKDLETGTIPGASSGFFGDYINGYKATESRFFLASHEAYLPDAAQMDYETTQSWGTISTTGGHYIPAQPKASPPIYESSFDGSAGDTYSGDGKTYLLRSLNNGNGVDVYDLNVNVGNTDNAYCAFIYKLTNNVSGTQFTLHYRVIFERYSYDANGNITATLGTKIYGNEENASTWNTSTQFFVTHSELLQPIAWSDFNGYTPPSYESTSLTSFPNPVYVKRYGMTGNTNPQKYAIQSKVISLADLLTTAKTGTDHDAGGTADGFTDWKFKKLDCWVEKSQPNVPIYVRGLRVRSHQAELVLTGDAYTMGLLNSFFYNKVESLISTSVSGVSAWYNTRGFEFGNEPDLPAFRVLAALDPICAEWTRDFHHNTYTYQNQHPSGIHLAPFITGTGSSSWAYYRTIYEDQNGVAPSPLTGENLGFFDMSYPRLLPYPKDGIDYTLRSNPSPPFFKSGVPLTGDANTDQQTGESSTYDYETYTNRFSNDRLGVWSYFAGAKFASPSYAVGNPTEISKFYAHISTIQLQNRSTLQLDGTLQGGTNIPVCAAFRQDLVTGASSAPCSSV